MSEKTYEKLGAFYLGRLLDENGKTTETPLLYDSRDLTTHAICVGMTGSGKTGLCIGLLEEAAIDGIPAIVIDPKGDLGNLLLTFPELRGADFEPWVDPDAARRKDLSVGEFAAAQASLWREGLASWGQDGERIRRMRAAADFTIYTPGSSAGVPISILDSFAAPSPEVSADAELLAERVSTVTTGLLGLIGVGGDPLQSREHVLVANVLSALWREDRAVDLGSLIGAIQSPPIERIGVMEVDSFFPEKARGALAMRLNALLAAPGFEQWLKGVPLDVGQLLYTPEGRPRIAIISIAHLSEGERMFFVSLLLNQVLSWARTRPGTSSLRALLYMDEIFGFLPPSAEPPSKRPFLTLLKQARAYGLGLVLATQNPIDLDYKALSNAGTWFLGRLQTERDKLRVLDGLEGATPGGRFDRATVERTLSGLGKRKFLLHNVHDDGPVLFNTRWVMSYLRGPLTRDQIRLLTPDRREPPPAPVVGPVVPAAGSVSPGGVAATRPILSSRVPQVFLPAEPGRPSGGASDVPFYRPLLVGAARVQFVDKKTKRRLQTDDVMLIAELSGGGDVDWSAAAAVDLVPEELESEPLMGARWAAVPDAAEKSTNYTRWRRAFADTLYRNHGMSLLHCATFGVTSKPGEMEGAFRVRLAEVAREQRDEQMTALRKRYARRLERLEERIRRAEQKIEREREQVSGQKMQTVISLGTTLLSAFVGRRKVSAGSVGRAATTARGFGRTAREKQDVRRAEENAGALRDQLRDLETELEDELGGLEDRLDPLTMPLEPIEVRPRRSDVDVRFVALGWTTESLTR